MISLIGQSTMDYFEMTAQGGGTATVPPKKWRFTKIFLFLQVLFIFAIACGVICYMVFYVEPHITELKENRTQNDVKIVKMMSELEEQKILFKKVLTEFEDMVINQTKNIKESIFEGNQKHIKQTREKSTQNETKMEKIIALSENQELMLLNITKGIKNLSLK